MPIYSILTVIERAEGTQLWEVEAGTHEEAIAIFKAGKAEFVSEEIVATSIGEPEIIGEESS